MNNQLVLIVSTLIFILTSFAGFLSNQIEMAVVFTFYTLISTCLLLSEILRGRNE